MLRSLELVIKVIQVLRVHKDKMECLVVMVRLEHKVQQDPQDQLVHKVLKGIRDYKVHRHI